MKHDGLQAITEALGLRLDTAQLATLEAYEVLLRGDAVRFGSIAASDAGVVRERHVLDSLRAAPLVGSRVVDLGSGAGLPGIVLAIARPDVTVRLVDTRRRRVALLELMVERLGLGNAFPVHSRVEEVSGVFDTATARAFANAAASWVVADRLLTPTGRLVYFAGGRFEAAEIAGLAVRAEVVAPPAPLACSGPLVIMTRE